MNPADFSNYGKTTVNVFAPGVQIYSTVPDNKYEAFNGTSMAAPVVAGIASLIRAYYPNLSAVQVKQAIESTVIKPESKVRMPGTKKKKTKYKKLCTTAGYVSASAALKAASTMK
jgi:subtilisin family serine protease